MASLKPVPLLDGVEVLFKDGVLSVNGVKGSICQKVCYGITFNISAHEVSVIPSNSLREKRKMKAFCGLYRSLLNNMIIGVSNGYTRKLEVVGVGYKVQYEQGGLKLSLGYSHVVRYTFPKNVECKVVDNVNIVLTSFDKQLVGQVAASIRKLRVPEPYKKKGIRYSGEIIRSKSGKAAKSK